MNTPSSAERFLRHLHVTRAFAAVWILTLVVVVVQFTVRSVFISSDTDSYFRAIDVFLSGDVDSFRTPVYPMILYFCRGIFGWFGALKGIEAFQSVAFLFALWYFYQTLHWFVKKESLKIIATFLLAFPFVTWNNAILTEPLAVSGSIFLIYFTFALYSRFTPWRAAAVAFWLLFLVFLRPAFVYLLPIYGLWGLGIWLLANKRPAGVATLAAALLTTGLLLGYMKAFENRYGVFAVSKVSLMNNLLSVQHNKAFDPRDISDFPAGRAFLADEMEYNGVVYIKKRNSFLYIYILIEKYGIEECDGILQRVNNSHNTPLENIKTHFPKSRNHSFVISTWSLVDGLYQKWGITLNVIYWFLGILGLMLIYQLTRRKILLFTFLLWTLCAANIAVVIIGAPGEWGRLLLPSFPFILILAVQSVEWAMRGIPASQILHMKNCRNSEGNS